MHDPSRKTFTAQPAYRIGAAARLTGISAHTLRKWEDRYAMVEPRRSAGGERLYSATDVKRLALVKNLAEGGMSLAELAELSLEQLEVLISDNRAAGREPATAMEPQARVSVAAVGAVLPTLLAQDGVRLRHARVLACGETVSQVRDALGDRSPDVVLLERPAVTAATGEEITSAMVALGARAAVLVYGFGNRVELETLRRPEVALVRAPAEAMEIDRLCLGLVASLHDEWPAPVVVERPIAGDATVPPPRWSRDTLARVAGMSNSIACECPRHLADLIMSLCSFEDYSAACENRDDKDAALHHHLKLTAATSRSLFEDALRRVAGHEGLDID